MPKNIESKENMIYSSAGKRDLRADVFYPARKSKKGYPAVILLFGGGWKSGDKSMSVPMARQIAAKGYVAVALNTAFL